MKRPKIDFMELEWSDKTPITAENLNLITSNINCLINRVNDLELEKSKRDSASKYILLIELITIILVILKLTKVINCSWFLVLSPLILLSVVVIIIVNIIVLKKH